MSQTQSEPASAAPEPSATAPAATRRSRGVAVAAIALIIVLAALYLAWHAWNSAQERRRATQDERQQLATRVETVARGAEQAHRDADTLRARLDDETKVNQSLREQILSLSERARLVEDAVANLADKRLSGHDAMLLNEAEMLLALGAERYLLFHDVPAAVDTYRLADTALAAADDAAFSTVRQSISAESAALAALKSADTSGTLAALTALRASVAQLPAAPRGLDAGAQAEQASRWMQVLGQFVRVHHGGDAAALVERHDSALARQLVALDLRDAEAALLARDEARYQAALADARELLMKDFDGAAAAVATARTTLDNLAKAPLAPPAPPILGASLKELRNLRATHALQQTPRAATPSNASPPQESRQ